MQPHSAQQRRGSLGLRFRVRGSSGKKEEILQPWEIEEQAQEEADVNAAEAQAIEEQMEAVAQANRLEVLNEITNGWRQALEVRLIAVHWAKSG